MDQPSDDLLTRLRDVLPASERRRLDAALTPRRVEREALLHVQDDTPSGVDFVREGYLILERGDAGGSVLGFRLLAPGGATGYRSLVSRRDAHHSSARALTDSQIDHLPRSVFLDLLDRNAVLARLILTELADDPGFMEAPVLRNPRLPVRARLAYLLHRLADTMGAHGHGRIHFQLPLRHDDLANFLGARAETVSRHYRDLQRDGVIGAAFGPRSVTVHDAEALAAVYREHI